jgi:hypothetical protein
MTVKEKMNEILEDFDEKDSCPNCFEILKGHFAKNTENDCCDGNCKDCWNQKYEEDELIIAIQDGINAVFAKIQEVYHA